MFIFPPWRWHSPQNRKNEKRDSSGTTIFQQVILTKTALPIPSSVSHVPLARPSVCGLNTPGGARTTPVHTADITGADLLSLVCRRYSTVKKLVVKPAPAETERNTDAAPREGAAVSVQIRFAGPQPSESCGALLCLLLGGDSVQARPVELPRGRKRKYSMSAEANDDVNPAGT